jgi:hypothetical protein
MSTSTHIVSYSSHRFHADDGADHADSFFFVEQEDDEHFVVANHTTEDENQQKKIYPSTPTEHEKP